MRESPTSFSKVWEDIVEALSKRTSISTLVRGIENEILDVSPDGIALRSEKTHNKRTVPRQQFERVWASLAQNGSYVSGAHSPFIHSQIICKILSLLDYVEVAYRPLSLHLRGFIK